MHAARLVAPVSVGSPFSRPLTRMPRIARLESAACRLLSPWSWLGIFSLILGLGIALLGTEPAVAQQATALLTGSVKDESGAVVVGAGVDCGAV